MDLLPRFSKPYIGCNNGESNHSVLINRKPKTSEDVDTPENISFFPSGSSVAVQ